MNLAFEEAQLAQERGEVPVGAIIVSAQGQVLARGGNETRAKNDPTAHAEIVAIRRACEVLGSERLIGCDLYVTLEPCPMCAAAISNARIARLYYGAEDSKSGGVGYGAKIFSHPQCHHVPEVYDGIGADRAEKMLTNFFQHRRK